ncbi:MAG: flagellar biosynthesis repressor FlbT, partial [Alphaproteobacteria bacterium HGW-Alphaproteobacteria-6]
RQQMMRGIEQLSQVLTDPDSRAQLTAATTALLDGQFYQALKALRMLLPREARLLAATQA